MTDDIAGFFSREPKLADTAVRMRNLAWLTRERTQYADVKYEPGGANYMSRLEDMREHGLGPGSTEMTFLTNYLKRAEILGLDTLAGRQAFGKFVVTAMAMLDRIVLAYGDLPEAGHPSGEIIQ